MQVDEKRESIEVHLAILPSISNFHDIFAKVRLFFKKRSTTASETILSDGSKFFFWFIVEKHIHEAWTLLWWI